MESASTGRRGRLAIPLAWTRVLHITPEVNNRVRIYSLFPEMELQKHLRVENTRLTLTSWEMKFWPKDFAKKVEIDDIEEFRLNAKIMERHGVTASKLRKILRVRAL